MSIFSNEAARSAEAADAYVRAILDVLDDRDPLEVLRGTPASLREMLSRHDAVVGTAGGTPGAPSEDAHAIADAPGPGVLSTPEAPGKWSVREVLRHLADSEIVWGWRLRRVLAEERPTLRGYDQDAWAERLGYAEADPAESVEEIEVLRRGHLRLLERASDDDLRRIGLHAERGEESVEHMIRLYAGHDLVHVRQVERILEAVGA